MKGHGSHTSSETSLLTKELSSASGGGRHATSSAPSTSRRATLAPLRARLASLRRRRFAERGGHAVCLLITAVVWGLAVLFALDWLLNLGRGARGGMLLLWIGTITAVLLRRILPLLSIRESDRDLALFVEKQQQIDSDLVAALEFETSESSAAPTEQATAPGRVVSSSSSARSRYGSPQLQQAVVEYVGEFSEGLNVHQGFSLRPLRRRGLIAAGSLLAATVAIAMFPAVADAFFQRLLLGSTHYPTRTLIEKLVICGVETTTQGVDAAAIVVPFGRPLTVELSCGGELPTRAAARILGETETSRTTLELAPTGEDGRYAGEIPRLLETVTVEVTAGDAYGDPRRVRVIAMPAVSVRLRPIAPAYASSRDETDSATDRGVRQLAVIEGSRVDLSLVCTNKRLRGATLRVGEETFELVARDKATETETPEWTLPEGAHPFAEVTAPISFQIQVEDEDGMTLERPLEGQIRLRPDKEPSVVASMVVRRVLPTARPVLDYEAADDLSLSKLRLRIQVTRKNGMNSEELRDVQTFEAGDPASRRTRGSFEIDLSSLKLEKDDGVKISMEAHDHRGKQPPRWNVSEPMVLQVTDREGIRAGVLESDEKLIRDLNSLIDLELGESK